MNKIIVTIMLIMALAGPVLSEQINIETGRWEDLRANINTNFTEVYSILANPLLAEMMALTPIANAFLGFDAEGHLANKTQMNLQFIESIEFEGATEDEHQTTFIIVDPTSTRSIVFPDDSGTVILSGHSITGLITGTMGDEGETVLTLTPGAIPPYLAGTEVFFSDTIIDPNAVYANDSVNHAVTLVAYTPAAFTITGIYLSCDSDPGTEPMLVFRHKPAGAGYGSSSTIETITTTAGAASVTTGFDDATIPAGSKIFIAMFDPDNDLKEIAWTIKGTWD